MLKALSVFMEFMYLKRQRTVQLTFRKIYCNKREELI